MARIFLPFPTARIPLAQGALVLHPCPGRSSADGSSLTDDIALIRAQGVTALLTLLDAEEIHKHGREQLPDACAEAGIHWLHLPVEDMAAPDAEFDQQWPAVLAQLQQHLQRGEAISMHCWGGTGRAGTVGTKLLLALGYPAAEAEALIKAARPGALELPCQRQYLGLDQ